MPSTSGNPNESQVGGSHYKSSFQHWDFVNTVLHGRYLEGCVTKYMRWRKKNGLQDLEKALHYIDKIISLYDGPEKIQDQLLQVLYCRWTPQFPSMAALHRSSFPHMNHAIVKRDTEKYCDLNELSLHERVVVLTMASWENTTDLSYAKLMIQRIIDESSTNPAVGKP